MTVFAIYLGYPNLFIPMFLAVSSYLSFHKRPLKSVFINPGATTFTLILSGNNYAANTFPKLRSAVLVIL